jgi:hypothetical protein
MMREKSGSDDEFFGDQSSESDCELNRQNNAEAIQNQFGAVANHDYRSHESSIKTLSYLDGFDETKDEKLQEGFCNGYKTSFRDAFQTGERLGLLSAKVALKESLTLNQDNARDDMRATDIDENSIHKLHNAAELVHKFLTNNILIGSADKELDDYYEAFEELSKKMKAVSD